MSSKPARLPLTEARINLGAVVKRVHLNKEYVILEKDGIPVAGLMNIDEFEAYLESRDPRVRRAIAESNRDIAAERTRPANDLLGEIRGRASRKPPRRRRG
jgi:PHD/YefM family antitoxin component YafN of YafNO toxin-antitoxin module